MKGLVLCAVLFALASSAMAKNGNCPGVVCYTFCDAGYLLDKNGCPSCSCQPRNAGQASACEERRCFVPCDTGYRLDTDTHCITCTCGPPTAVVPRVQQVGLGFSNSSSGSGGCNRIRCVVPCSKGYRLDSKGCPSCECSGDARHVMSGGKDEVLKSAKPVSSGAGTKNTRLAAWLRNFIQSMHQHLF